QPADGHEPSGPAVAQPEALPQVDRIRAGPKMRGIRAGMDHAEPLAVPVEAQIPEDCEGQVARPVADREEHGRAAEDRAGHAALDRGLPDFVLLAQQVRAVQEQAVRHAQPLVHPAGRISGRLHVAAVNEPHLMLARQTRGAPRPEEHARQRLGAADADREAVDCRREPRVHFGRVGVAWRRDDQLALGKPTGQLTVQRSASSPSSRMAAAATAAGSSGSTRNPVSPSRTASGIPPERVPMTGRPEADASRMEMPNPSTSRSYRRETSTNTSAALYSAGRSSSGTKPRSRTASPSPISLTSPSSAPRRFPIPATA